MTDNRTTELLCEGLTERGIEWTASRYSGARHAEHTKWTTASGNHAKYTEYDDGQTVTTIEARNLTPEQAIAATLGRPKAKSHPYGYERDTGAYDCTRCECGCINDISAKYCNDCGGEIEIDESAEKEYYDGCSKHMVFAKKHDDGSLELCERRYVPEESATRGALTAEQVMKIAGKHQPDYCSDTHVCFDWQAIADELNELGSGTCENAGGKCSACGAVMYDAPNFCASCGAKVVER